MSDKQQTAPGARTLDNAMISVESVVVVGMKRKKESLWNDCEHRTALYTARNAVQMELMSRRPYSNMEINLFFRLFCHATRPARVMQRGKII